MLATFARLRRPEDRPRRRAPPRRPRRASGSIAPRSRSEPPRPRRAWASSSAPASCSSSRSSSLPITRSPSPLSPRCSKPPATSVAPRKASRPLRRRAAFDAHRVMAWHQAGLLWLERADDAARGRLALEQAVAIDPTHEEAVLRLQALCTAAGDAKSLALAARASTRTSDRSRRASRARGVTQSRARSRR